MGSGTHSHQTAKVLVELEEVLTEVQPDAVVVPGDVNSTMAAAVCAVKLDLPVVHLEAGLRSRDRTMPEEHNRVIADHLGDLLLTPSRDGDQNLLAENIPAERIAFVGNTMIDSLRKHEERARSLAVGPTEHGVEDYVLVTLHRPAVVDHPERLVAVMQELDELALEGRPVLFPVHPRTAANLERAGWKPAP